MKKNIFDYMGFYNLFNSIKYFWLYYFIAFGIFLLLLLVLNYSLSPEGINLLYWQIVQESNESNERIENTKNTNEPSVSVTSNQVRMPFYKILREKSTVILETKTNLERDKTYYLYLPQVSASYFSVYSNGRLIGSYGFENNRYGHFWYQPFIFQLPKDTREIRLDVTGVYEIGIDFVPVIVQESQQSKYLVAYIITHFILILSMGLTLTLSTVLFLISRNISGRKRKVYQSFSLASFLATVWMIDLIPLPTMGNSLSILIIRKILVSSAYFGLSALLYGLCNQIYESPPRYIKALIYLDLIAGIVILFAWNNYILKLMSNNISFLLFINAIIIGYVVSKTYSQIQILFSSIFVLCVMFDGLVMFLSIKQKLLSPFGIVAVFAGFSFILVNEYKDMIVSVSISHMKSITDPLTGAYNRGALYEMNLQPGDSLVYIDLNKFKMINDIYGHEKGDEILKLLVSKLKGLTRKTDAVIRMGGDEFLLILKECPVEKAIKIADHIRREFNQSHELNPDFSYGVAQFTGDIEISIRNVDQLMYEMKEKTRNKK
ncbi:MAG: GGDEF domain-containing protein [Fervidobacterium sp.]